MDCIALASFTHIYYFPRIAAESQPNDPRGTTEDAPKGQVSSSWFRLDEAQLHPCLPIHSWHGRLPAEANLLNAPLPKRFSAHTLRHFFISLSTLPNATLAKCAVPLCQRKADGRNGSDPSLRPTNVRADSRPDLGVLSRILCASR